MSIWDDLAKINAEADHKAFKQNKSDNVKQHEQLNNRKAFISKKHNLATGKSYVHKRRS